MTRWKVGLHTGWCLAAALLAVELMPAPLPASPVARPVDAAALLPALAAVAPVRSSADGVFELTLRSDRDDLVGQLSGAGAAPGDVRRVVELLRPYPEDGAGGVDHKLTLGAETGGKRPIVALAMLTELGAQRIVRGPDGLRLEAQARARRVSATVDGGAYWSLRAAGIAPEVAIEAARLANVRLGAGPGARIDVIIGERPARFGSATSAHLLYVAVDRRGQPKRRLLAMPGDGDEWVDPDRRTVLPSALARPVDGRVTSGFGARFHPILHFFRPHRGVDYAARFGEPVRAVADGCVTRSGWRGGYGRQVRIAHRGTLASSYSHLADLSVGEGQCVRRGEVIGQAGASGLATGPHLHFELYRGGQPVDPRALLSVPGASDDAARAAIAARLARIERA